LRISRQIQHWIKLIVLKNFPAVSVTTVFFLAVPEVINRTLHIPHVTLNPTLGTNLPLHKSVAVLGVQVFKRLRHATNKAQAHVSIPRAEDSEVNKWSTHW